MQIELRPVTQENWEECVRLKVRDDQRGLVATNAYSLAQAAYEPFWLPRAIYDGDTMVGFCMCNLEPHAWEETPENWIVRLMVDAKYQGKGYGRAAMEWMVQEFRALPECPEVWISFEPDNKVAERLYLSLGFEQTGRVIDGETCLKLRL